jgi:hypothetical protein
LLTIPTPSLQQLSLLIAALHPVTMVLLFGGRVAAESKSQSAGIHQQSYESCSTMMVVCHLPRVAWLIIRSPQSVKVAHAND